MDVNVTDNSAEFLNAFSGAVSAILEALGLAGEGFAKVNITDVGAVDTGNLRNSITHASDESESAAYIGTNVHYAAYVELGTGSANVSGGTNKPSWVYRDASGEYHRAFPMKPRPYLKPAVADHAKEYQEIIKSMLKNA